MDFNKINVLSRKKQALINAHKCCGTMKRYTEKLEIPWSTGEHWKNNPDTEIPYAMILLNEIHFGIPMESLITKPEQMRLAILFRKNYKRITPVTCVFKLKNIVLPKRLFYQKKLSHHAIVIASDCSLISGFSALRRKAVEQATEVSGLVIDRNSLLLDKRSLKEVNPYPFTITERFLIYLDLKEHTSGHSLKKDDLSIKNTSVKDLMTLLDLGDVFFIEQIAQLIEFGTIETIRAFDQGQLTIGSALQTIKSPETSL